jgi:hypothetical protein
MKPERLYRIVWVSDAKGTRGIMADGPLTHDEACTVLSKITVRPERRVLLEELAPASE